MTPGKLVLRIREGKWKLIGAGKAEKPTLRCLDNANPEVKNHAAEQPEVVARLEAMHEAWLKEVTPK